jgi:uncharacterized membrane protein YwaF
MRLDLPDGRVMILETALYELTRVVREIQDRPTRKDFHWVVGVGLAYLALVVPINGAFGFNYGYLGRSLPSQPSLLDWLGPWPWRVGAMAVLSWLGMTLLLLPWEWLRPKATQR